MSIANKLEYLQETKNQIKTAITEKGVTVSDTDTFRSYANKIRSIEAGGGTSNDDWQPEPDWWDIETILENDTEDYSQKIICLLTDELDDKATTSIVQGAEKYKLSDGQNITGVYASITNKFDITQDKVCSKGYKTRYIIYYRNSDFSTGLTLPNNAIYVIFSGVNFNNKPFQSKRFLQAIKFKNDTKFIGTNMDSMFNSCYDLKKISNLDTSNVTNMDNMFYYCCSLRKIANLDTSNAKSMVSMFAYCNLKKIPNLDTSKATNISGMFSNCCSLKEVHNLDISNITNMNNMFSNCYSLTNIQNIYNIKVNISFSNSSYLNHSTLLRILNALVDLTDQITQKLTLGSANLAKLTDEEKAIATNKNWTLA